MKNFAFIANSDERGFTTNSHYLTSTIGMYKFWNFKLLYKRRPRWRHKETRTAAGSLKDSPRKLRGFELVQSLENYEDPL